MDQIELPQQTVNVAIPANAFASIAGAADPEAALRDFAAELIRSTLSGPVGSELANRAFKAGDAYGVERMKKHMLSSPALSDMLRQSFQAGRDREHRELHLDPVAIDGLAKALAGAVAASPAPVVNVSVPESKPRRQIATELPDGRILMEDVANDA